MTDALGTVTRYVRDAAGNVLRQIDAEGKPEQRITVSTYDVLNRKTSLTDGEGHTTQFGYDLLGNMTLIRDATGVEAKRVYDLRSRVTREIDPASGTTNYEYDSAGNLTKVTDASGAITSTDYDDANRSGVETDANGQQRVKTYDLRDNVVTESDALGNTAAYKYDLLDRLSERTDASGRTWKWKYNVFDKQVEITKRSGAIMTLGYDNRHMMKTMFGVFFRAYNYDDAGNVTSATATDGGTRTITYDALNRPAQITWNSWNVQTTYDALSRKVAVTDELGTATTRYTWDRADRLVSVTAPSGKTVETTFDPADRATRIAFPSGNETRLNYDVGGASANTGRITSVARGLDNGGVGGSPLNQLLGTFTYTYDTRGNIKSITEPRRARSYTYDALERLTKVEEPQTAPNPPLTKESYTFDAEGNRVATHASAFHVTAPANRLIEDEAATYEYDADGNMVSKAIKSTAAGPNAGKLWRYTYDGADRLTLAQLYTTPASVTPERQVLYKYDAFDRRYVRAENTGASVSEGSYERLDYYSHDGENVYRVITDRPGVTGGRDRITWFTHGAGVDDLMMATQDAGQSSAASTYTSISSLFFWAAAC